MPKAKTDSFITELPLLPTPAQVRTLLVPFDVARQVYNACLGESLKRLDLLRQSRLYQRARKLPKGKERNEAFKAARSESRTSGAFSRVWPSLSPIGEFKQCLITHDGVLNDSGYRRCFDALTSLCELPRGHRSGVILQGGICDGHDRCHCDASVASFRRYLGDCT
jgi:hypothetical protein